MDCGSFEWILYYDYTPPQPIWQVRDIAKIVISKENVYKSGNV